MLGILASIYLRLKSLLRKLRWLVFLLAIVLIYFLGRTVRMISEGLVSDPDNVPAMLGIGILVVAAFVGGFWSIYFILERLVGNRESFGNFVSRRLPGRKKTNTESGDKIIGE